jgi:type IV pilus assembly protein PilO
MNLQFEKREWLLIAGSILLGLCISAGVYLLLYNPVQQEITLREQDLETEEQLISILEEKSGSIQQKTFQSSVALQKKVPVKPMTEKLVLDLEKAETISNSFISSIQFSEGDVTLPLTPQSPEEDIENLSTDDSEAEGETGETEAGTETETETEAQPQEILPQGLKKLSATLSVESPSYFEMERFLEVLEELDRITEIEQVAFEGPEESTMQGESYDKVSYKLVVAAFYLPDLLQLLEEMPGLKTPAPANKVNPFSSYSDLDKEKEDE